jgi:small subunit ribosomal protein S18
LSSEYSPPPQSGGRPPFAPGGGARPPRKEYRTFNRRKICYFCKDHVTEIDYKDLAQIRKYMTDRGKIEPRRKSGTCAKHQRRLTIALKRGRFLALLPYTASQAARVGITPTYRNRDS